MSFWSFPINWPSLLSTARSPIILWRLWFYKPSHKHDSNKHQSKAIVICNHKSDETRSVTHVNKAYLVWLMFRVLSNQHYQHRTNQKLRSWANAVFQNRGVCGQAVPSFPSPVIPFFFLLSSQLSRRTRKETLATLTQAINKSILINLYHKLILIEVTTFFFIVFIDWYRKSIFIKLINYAWNAGIFLPPH